MWRIYSNPDPHGEQNADYESNDPVYSDNDSLVSDQLSETEMGSAEENIPLAKLAKKFRKERENSSSEDDIPLYELSKRLKQRKSEHSNPTIKTESDDESDMVLDIDECTIKTKKSRKRRINEAHTFLQIVSKLSTML
jgi:hypothetical protein